MTHQFYEKLYMSKTARNFLDSTIKRLYAFSGNQCAFPDCKETLFNSDNEINKSNICHIEAAEPGGQRYNPNSTDEYRRSYDNLILLCPNHHKETDNANIFTVEVLQDIKRKHHDKIRTLLSEQNILTKYPSALNTVILRLGRTIFEKQYTNDPDIAPNPEDKISYNNVIRYKPIIKLYAVYQGKINQIYGEIEKHGSSQKELVLENISTLYFKEKGKYQTFDEIKANADNIIEGIENSLWEIVNNSSNKIDLPYEAVNISILILLVDAFMRCNILEDPPKP